MKTNNKYGVFYKSHGKWIGPYNGQVTSKTNANRTLNSVKSFLKSKTSVRRVKVS